MTKATTENTALVRYLNAFARAHVGPEATWSSVVVTKGVHSKVHHDLHNLVGTAPPSDIEAMLGNFGSRPRTSPTRKPTTQK